MSRKRTKQYLMLLMVIGLVSVAAGGSGTFASFSAETTNAGNYFATGSLFLHNTANGGTECTSESASTNLNDGTNGDTCNTIFTVDPGDLHAHYATLKLQNAGSLDASGIKFRLASACLNSRVYESNGSLNAVASATDSDITVHNLTHGIPNGGWIFIDDGVNSEEVQVSHVGGYGLSATTIHLATPLANGYANGTAIKFSPAFSGGGTICDKLDFTVTETDASFNYTGDDTGTTGAVGCAYGTLSGTSDGCDFTAADNLGAAALQSDTALTLSSGANTNTLTQLDAQKYRYFVIGIKADDTGGGFDNKYQDSKAKFDLVWHIDQA